MPQTWLSQEVSHPGASLEQIQGEPNWSAGHNHRVGLKNLDNRRPGHVATGPDDAHTDEKAVDEARLKFELLRGKARKGELINFRDFVRGMKDFNLAHPERRAPGWRYVLQCTEDEIKFGQDWPANLKRQQKKEKSEDDDNKNQDDKNGGKDGHNKTEKAPGEHQEGSLGAQEGGGGAESALLQQVREDIEYQAGLKENDGLGKSPQAVPRKDTTIDQVDQYTPDHWFPREPALLRITGPHPMNAETPLTQLLDAGLITPNHLHYVRNHGSVPFLVWEFHEVEVKHGDKNLVVSMEDLETQFPAINIPVSLACDGNRRKELNMIRTSKGFGWGAGAVGCAYWKGPLLRDVLLAAGVPDPLGQGAKLGKERWINFEGAEDLAEGKYSTCIPLEYAMDPANDVILAYHMNDLPLPPDHGFPIRVVVPGYVGGKSVKWLRRMWTSEKENNSHYHIWDNRVLPSFVTDTSGPLAAALFHDPSTACSDQILNSVIVRPDHGEDVQVGEKQQYRVQGYAYNGSGSAVDRVEISLDEGRTWLLCSRRFPEAPIRHGKKFWTWLHWHVDVDVKDFLISRSLVVRCWDASKNTQPETPNWNVMGMMNNARYRVEAEVLRPEDTAKKGLYLRFKHPVAPGTGKHAVEGWMTPSVANQVEAAKQHPDVGGSQKRFTREEVEKHDREDDCWIVVGGHVYDATSVLSWHPGGAAPIMAHAGRVHHATSEEFDSIHDTFARNKLKECHLGTLSEKAARFMDRAASHEASRKGQQTSNRDTIALHKDRWTAVKLVKREAISEDTKVYTFQLPADKKILGLATGQHLQLGFHLKDKMLTRPYTPTRPIFPARDQSRLISGYADEKSLFDGDGTFDLTVKTYYPTDEQPGGAMSNILDNIPVGEQVDVKGPQGDIIYHGHGRFTVEGKERRFHRVSLILGGSGITPGYCIVARIAMTEGDTTEVRILDANKASIDILMRKQLEDLERRSQGRIKVTYVLAEPDPDWEGPTGFVTEDMMREHLFGQGRESVAFMCGPPAMISKVVLPGLKSLGYTEDETMFGF